MASVCVIPARRDSKRLRDKVLRTAGGHTLLRRCVDTVIAAACFDLVLVSTEDQQIAKVAVDAGVPVRDRPLRLAGDTVGVAEVVLDACAALEGRQPDWVACLSPVYPLLEADSVRRAQVAFDRAGADFLTSVVPTDPHHFHWALEPTEDGRAEMFFGDRFLMDRAFLPPIYSPTGAIKMARLDALAGRGFFFGANLVPFDLSLQESYYVGDELDLEFVEFLIQRRSRSRDRRQTVGRI